MCLLAVVYTWHNQVQPGLTRNLLLLDKQRLCTSLVFSFFLRFKSNTKNYITFKVSKLLSIFTNVLVASRSSKRVPCCYVSIKKSTILSAYIPFHSPSSSVLALHSPHPSFCLAFNAFGRNAPSGGALPTCSPTHCFFVLCFSTFCRNAPCRTAWLTGVRQ
jgi:hypothetical protein